MTQNSKNKKNWSNFNTFKIPQVGGMHLIDVDNIKTTLICIPVNNFTVKQDMSKLFTYKIPRETERVFIYILFNDNQIFSHFRSDAFLCISSLFLRIFMRLEHREIIYTFENIRKRWDDHKETHVGFNLIKKIISKFETSARVGKKGIKTIYAIVPGDKSSLNFYKRCDEYFRRNHFKNNH